MQATGEFTDFHYSKEEFEELSLEQQFQTVFSGLREDNWREFLKRNDIPLNEALYSLRLKNMSGYMEACHFCGDKRCEGCPVPFDKNITLGDFLIKLGVKSNVSFYNDGYKRGKNDVVIEIVWSNKIDKQYFDSFSSAVSFPNK